ncbi:MAG TPA: HAMP domain-containing sensor histidine kinase [Terriglobales bacterium]|nr:HAMP domain-containing sensor histidine kinase [Terriglobales bacterium]
MRFSLFWRLFIGYLAVFALLTAISVYAVQELRRFDVTTRSILERDRRVLDYEKKLADNLLSQIRYERKFVITKDEALYREFVKFNQDFETYLAQALAASDVKTAPILERVQQDYKQYLDLFANERVQLKRRQNYAQGWYEKEKNKATDDILASLDRLQAERHEDTYEKVRSLAEAGARAHRAAAEMAVAALGFILVISFIITRSIARPMKLLKNKTREIARGKFEGDLHLKAPPEISELAEAFNQMCQKLNALDKMKSDFFASMSHELRTPLTSIKEGTSLLLDGVGGATTEKQKKLLRILVAESNRLIGLVNSLLDLSKMEAGMMHYSFKKSSIVPLIRKAADEVTPLLESKKIRLSIDIGETLPSIDMDNDRMLQALRNLIGNAVKFTPVDGQVNVAAKQVDHQLRVTVHDTGPGIAPENLHAIFDKFRQGNAKGAYSANGSGLGLAIVKHVITSHGGDIWAENHPERGSVFTFVLPC